MTATAETAAPEQPNPVEELAGRLFNAGVQAADLFTVHLGTQLGLYRAIDEHGPLTSAELAEHTGLAERYVREWLQGQATNGLVVPDSRDVSSARFRLAPGVRETLLDPTSPSHLAPMAEAIASVGEVLPRIVAAFRSGDGVPYADYPDGARIQDAFNRPAYTNDLVTTWLPAMPDVQARLADATRPARVGDLGCGAGWSAVMLAKAYPHLTVEGIDNDRASIEAAQEHAEEKGVADRVRFRVADLSEPDADGGARYDVAFIFECLHDLPRPVEALANPRRWIGPDGTLIVMDERANESLTTPGDEVERFFAQISTLWCLPQGLVGKDPEPVGTLLRPAKLRELAAKAGFTEVTVLDLEHPFWRFYRLRG
jgi:2-polyprenyl-3-methyl-5-hydroxy-6-metoxy-1,4-benzoquinol methylase